MARAGSADLPDGESEIFFAGGLDRKSVICPSGNARWCLLVHLSRLRGRSTRSSERGGWGKSLHSTSLSAEAPPPQPSPASGRGSAAVQAEPVKPLHAPHARAVLAPRAGGCWRTSPACGGGRRARRARRVGEVSPLDESFRGGTPTPTLPRKRERERSGASRTRQAPSCLACSGGAGTARWWLLAHLSRLRGRSTRS